MRKLLVGMLALSMTVACSKEEANNGQGPESNQPTPIVFGSAITGNAKSISGDAFKENDQIKVLGFTGADVPTDVTSTDFNAVFTQNASNAFTAPDGTAYWQKGMKHHFYTYYPNDLVLTGSELAMTSTDGGFADEILWTKSESNLYAGTIPTVVLDFDRKLSKVSFVVKTKYDAKLTEISFKLSSKAGTINVLTGAVTTTPETPFAMTKTTDIDLKAADANGQTINWDAFIMPAATISDIQLVINGQASTVTFAEGTTILTKAGYETVITLSLNATGTSFGDSTIGPWEKEEAPEGDID